MRVSSAASSGQRDGCLTRKRGDSGMTKASTAAATMGVAPPMMNSPRHPTVGSAAIAAKPASVAPTGTQTMASVTAKGRCRSGTYSAASAAALGIAPPRPMPASSRRTPSVATSCAPATTIVVAPNSTMQPSSALRRPIRSPA